MSEQRVLTSIEYQFSVMGDDIFKQYIEWRRDGKVIRRGHRMQHGDGRLYKPIQIKYEEVPA